VFQRHKDMSDVNVRQNARQTIVLADIHLEFAILNITEVCHVKQKWLHKLKQW